jgi:metal transporter CNNM
MSLLLSLIIVAVLVFLSAIYSGLNVALLSLNIPDLERKAKLGNVYAKKLLPLRKNSNLTIASIIIANVATISAVSLVLDRHLNGFIAGLISTLLIVIFSEVLPQAFFIRRSLDLSGKLVPVMEILIFITYPISKPLDMLLDKLLGNENHNLMSRNELGILIAEHTDSKSSELDSDEIEIMMGALRLSEKQVKSIMTPIEKTYWFTQDTKLTPEKIDEMKANSYSRIPVFNSKLTNFYGVILMKDLVDVDFDEETVEIDDIYLHPSQTVGSLMALDTLFRKFILGDYSHMIAVEKNDKIVGVVTIEDLLEEILQHEIVDETDKLKHRI